MKNRTWRITDTLFEGLPLHLRRPDFENILLFKNTHSILARIQHNFDFVKNNGLPTAEYNDSLIDFDGEVVHLFEKEEDGIIFLIETYGCSRTYWFYVNDESLFKNQFEKLQKKNKEKDLESSFQKDLKWKFLKYLSKIHYSKENN